MNQKCFAPFWLHGLFRSDLVHLAGWMLCEALNQIRFLYVYLFRFLPERDYVTFGPLLSQFRLVCPLSVCLSSVTLVHPTRGLNLSAKFLHRCLRWPSSDLPAKFHGDSLRGTPPLGALNARGASKQSDFGPIEGYIS